MYDTPVGDNLPFPYMNGLFDSEFARQLAFV